MKNHTEANCFKRRDAIKALKQNRKQGSKKGKEKAHAAQEEDSDSAQAAGFAGNASTLDHSTTPTPSPSHAETDWIVDTGATCHMTPNRHWFNQYTPKRTPIRLANNTIIYSEGIGTVCFQPFVNGKPGRLLEFERVLYVPNLKHNLLSALYLTKTKSYVVIILHDKILFKRDSALLFTASIAPNNSATLNGQVIPSSALSTTVSSYPLDWAL